MSETPCMWLTRPEGENERIASMLGEYGIASQIAPLVEIHPTVIKPFASQWRSCDAVLLTSRHALPALCQRHAWGEIGEKTPIFSVGEVTAMAAREAGFECIVTGKKSLPSLLPHLTESLPAGARIYYPSAEHVAWDVASLLAPYDLHVLREPVYEAIAVPSLPLTICNAVQARVITGVGFFSPRHAQIGMDLLKCSKLLPSVPHLTAYAFSERIAQPLGVLSWHAIVTAGSPSLREWVEAVQVDTRHRYSPSNLK